MSSELELDLRRFQVLPDQQIVLDGIARIPKEYDHLTFVTFLSSSYLTHDSILSGC